MRTDHQDARLFRLTRWLPLALAFLLGLTASVSAQVRKAMPARSSPAQQHKHGRKATLPQLYEFFFVFANHVESRSIADMEHGLDRAFYRRHLQVESGLTAVEYAPVLEAAQHFAAVDSSIRKQVAQEEKAFRELRATSAASPGVAQHRATLRDLLTKWSSSLQSEIANVRAALGEERASALETYLQTKYVARSVGPALPNPNGLRRLKGGHTVTPDDVTFGGSLTYSDDFSLDDDNGDWGAWQIGAEGRISYLGSPTSNSTEFYAYMTWATDILGDWDLDPYSIEGDFYIDGSLDSGLTCYFDNTQSCEAGADGYVELTSGNDKEYSWDAVGSGTISFDLNCYDDDFDLVYCSADSEDYGADEVSVVILYPDINTVSPSSFNQGTSGSFTIDGEYLESAFENPPTVTVTNQSSLFSTFEVTPPSSYPDGDIVVHYTVTDNATPGTYTLTVNNGFGSDTYEVTIPSPPTITGISVPGGSLLANTTQTVTLTGTNFGTAQPSITVATDEQYVNVNSILSNSETSVSVSVTTALLSPGGTASFELTASNGHATSPALTVVAIQVPAPQIMMATSAAAQQTCTGLTEIDGQTTAVFAGQPMFLCAPAPSLPSGITVTGWTWTPQNIVDLTGGWVASAASGLESPNPTMSGTTSGIVPLTFYWVNPDSTEAMTYSYCTNNGQCPSVTAAFDISGPTGNILPTASLQTNNTATQIAPTAQSNPATMQMANAPGHPAVGVWITDSAALPQGQFIWVQVINSTTYSQLVSANPGGYTPPANLGLGLDGVYPYPPASASAVSDAPGRGDLFSLLGEANEAFDATMFVLWDPAIPPAGQGSCTPAHTVTTTTPYTSVASTCASIPIPLASVRWQWNACAIDALVGIGGGTGFTPSWLPHCGPGYSFSPAASGYPQWTTCDKSKYGGC